MRNCGIHIHNDIMAKTEIALKKSLKNRPISNFQILLNKKINL